VAQAPDLTLLWTEVLRNEHEGRDRAAADLCAIILRAVPDEPAVLGKSGNLLCRLGDTARGLDALHRVVTLRPRDLDGCIALAAALFDARQYRKAIWASEEALVVDPRSVSALRLRGEAELHLGRLAEAAAGFALALAIAPEHDGLHRQHAQVLHRLGRLAEAVEAYDKALGLRPDPETWCNRADALWRLSRFDAAAASIQAALPLSARPAELLCELARWQLAAARHADAASVYQQALGIDPRCARARLGLCIAQLSPVGRTEAEIDAARQSYAEHLRRLGEDFDREYAAVDLGEAAGVLHPFHLAYQGRNDRELQAAYGSIMCRAMAARFPQQALASPCRAQGKRCAWALSAGSSMRIRTGRFRCVAGSRSSAGRASGCSAITRKTRRMASRWPRRRCASASCADGAAWRSGGT
jgi:tetratricopeptide (TPR) repeat protein